MKYCIKRKELEYLRTDAYIKEKDNVLEIRFIGSGFLKYMVRTIVGILIYVGLEKYEINDILLIR